MVGIVIGATLTAGFLLVVHHVRTKGIPVKWWQWILTFFGFLYAAFVLKMIESFLSEDSVRAAIVTGVIFGFVAVVWGVLLARFVFFKKSKIKSK